MDVNQLRHELTQGIRLPEPEKCPNNIADIIQQCFREDPHDRPDFDMIKQLIENEYDLLITHHNASEVSNEEHEKLLYENVIFLQPSKDDKMKERYLDMRRQNKMRKKDENDENDDVFEMEEDVSVALRAKKQQDISLETVFCSTSMIPLRGSGEDQWRDSEARSSLLSSNYRPPSIISNKYKQLSPGSNDMKSFFSSSAINTISQMLEPPVSDRKISQSLNPLYMMVGSGFNSDELVKAENVEHFEMETTSFENSYGASKPIIRTWIDT